MDCRLSSISSMKKIVIYIGVGGELKKMFALMRIKPTDDCLCEERASLMDIAGPMWCRENLDEIVGWLEEEAHKRGLPFLRRAGEIVVKRACRKVERRIGLLQREYRVQGAG